MSGRKLYKTKNKFLDQNLNDHRQKSEFKVAYHSDIFTRIVDIKKIRIFELH